MVRDDDERSAELIALFLDGERSAIDELYRLHSDPLRHFVWCVVRRADDSLLDDLTQKVWLEVFVSAAASTPSARSTTGSGESPGTSA